MAYRKGKVGKLRTRSAAKKRFKVTGKGKFTNNKPAHNHLLQQKSKRQKRIFRKKQLSSNSFKKQLKRLMPHA